jgi:hypothetical protein
MKILAVIFPDEVILYHLVSPINVLMLIGVIKGRTWAIGNFGNELWLNIEDGHYCFVDLIQRGEHRKGGE